jgi:hypothetical protein
MYASNLYIQGEELSYMDTFRLLIEPSTGCMQELQARHYMYNVTLRYVRATTVAVENQ